MELDELICHARLVAEDHSCGCDCAYQHDVLEDCLLELKQYRSLGDMDYLQSLVTADREGRLKIRKPALGLTCEKCANFVPDEKSAYGFCKIKKHPRNRYRMEDKTRIFRPARSRTACVSDFEMKV